MFILYFVLITDCLTKCPLDLELKISPDQVKVELDFFFSKSVVVPNGRTKKQIVTFVSYDN